VSSRLPNFVEPVGVTLPDESLALEVIARLIRMTGGNFRLLTRLPTQIERFLCRSPDQVPDKMKTGKLGEVNSTVDKPSTLVGFFQQIFCMPFPSIGVEQDRFGETDIGQTQRESQNVHTRVFWRFVLADCVASQSHRTLSAEDVAIESRRR
jgi:hypothetical protein